MLELSETAAAEGCVLRPQVPTRANPLLLGFQVLHPFQYKPSYLKIASLPLAERVVALRDPELRRRILSEESVGADPKMACF